MTTKTKYRIARTAATLAGLLLPVAVFAQTSGGGGSCSGPFNNLTDIAKFGYCFLTVLIEPLIFAIALVVFLWGMVKFLQAKDSSEREDGQKFMIWGVVALAVMLGVIGIIKILGGTFGIHTDVFPKLPSS